ncbi:unnamed protein product [Lota lota]
MGHNIPGIASLGGALRHRDRRFQCSRRRSSDAGTSLPLVVCVRSPSILSERLEVGSAVGEAWGEEGSRGLPHVDLMEESNGGENRDRLDSHKDPQMLQRVVENCKCGTPYQLEAPPWGPCRNSGMALHGAVE